MLVMQDLGVSIPGRDDKLKSLQLRMSLACLTGAEGTKRTVVKCMGRG